MTKFWPDLNFAWYLDMSEGNTGLASGNFQNCEVVKPSVYFQIYLEIEYLENQIWVEFGDNGQPTRDCKDPV